MPSSQKIKGKGWENELAKRLTGLFHEPFCRVPSSGAFLGGKNFDRRHSLSEGQIMSFRGDIIPPDGWKFFNTEAKFYKEFPFHQLFSGEVKLLDSWTQQLLATANPGDLNLIFMKFNRIGHYVAFEPKESFVTNHHSIYNNSWNFTSWDDFFAFSGNLDIIKNRSLGR